MTSPSPTAQSTLQTVIEGYLRESEGRWRSQRRYYTLQQNETQEVVSLLTVAFLEPGSDDLCHLAQLHQLESVDQIECGVLTTWESNYIGPSPRQTKGSTIFGVEGDKLYRDRGFSTNKPVIARFSMRDDKTMCLRTEYSNNLFEEEVRLVGTRYRTRQTIISRAGEQQMIGQYLETRY